MLPKYIFMSGIGTNVGKTIVSAILAEVLQADYWKPMQTGLAEGKDKDTIAKLISNSKTKIHQSVYELELPASPNIAAKAENLIIDLSRIVLPQTENKLIIEGAGGLMVPMSDETTFLEFIQQHKLAVVLVVNDYLGCINHTLLSLEVLKQREISVLFGVFNGFKHEKVRTTIKEMSSCKWLNIDWAENANNIFVLEQAKKLRHELSAI